MGSCRLPSGSPSTDWVAVPGRTSPDVKIPPVTSFKIDDMIWSAEASVRITVTEKGASLHYTVTLAREGAG
jgi:hypothetical protein